MTCSSKPKSQSLTFVRSCNFKPSLHRDTILCLDV
uniref:Uncharacterized protein n=1 Tax=Anguilla anguilla TaxID=7936 RepID=A0A0E9V475_ANGAN